MKHYNLTPEQREWMHEIQRDFTKEHYASPVKCDPETGRVTVRSLCCGTVTRVGFLPKKAIPYRSQMLANLELRKKAEIENEESRARRLRERPKGPRLLPAQGEHHFIMWQTIYEERARRGEKSC
ncbi:hypothetical protein CMI41_02115 [Candidatus Pacearchaeota archaeon]|jgi:hypothetical protein|nr:hypothetical protein [Candidatus Pacearchaeota archaeon]|tara:strand:- start:671 stop:1045 length:375 start_codon:yes stop_codon:yes gene_type:complete